VSLRSYLVEDLFFNLEELDSKPDTKKNKIFSKKKWNIRENNLLTEKMSKKFCINLNKEIDMVIEDTSGHKK
jgi:hypothetical protein